MALRPPRPARRRARSNPFNRSLSDEALGLIAGFLLAATSARLLTLAAGLAHWTTTWKVINALTIWAVWPLELLGIGQEPELVGLLRPVDVVSGAILSIVAFYLLATRTYRRRA